MNFNTGKILLAHRVFDVIIRLDNDLLGTVPKNQNIYSDFIRKKAEEAMLKDGSKGIPHASGDKITPESTEKKLDEEQEGISELEERGWTGFHTDKDSGRPMLYDYHFKGFLKESASVIKQWPQTGEDKGANKQLASKVSKFLFVTPREILLPQIAPEPLERPLRAQTAQGPRVTLVRSDVIKAGAQFDIRLIALEGGGFKKDLIEALISYGKFQGLGQWRSGGYGRMTAVSVVELTPEEAGTA